MTVAGCKVSWAFFKKWLRYQNYFKNKLKNHLGLILHLKFTSNYNKQVSNLTINYFLKLSVNSKTIQSPNCPLGDNPHQRALKTPFPPTLLSPIVISLSDNSDKRGLSLSSASPSRFKSCQLPLGKVTKWLPIAINSRQWALKQWQRKIKNVWTLANKPPLR